MSNWTRFIAGFDVHGDKQNKAACEVFFRFIKDCGPAGKLKVVPHYRLIK